MVTTTTRRKLPQTAVQFMDDDHRNPKVVTGSKKLDNARLWSGRGQLRNHVRVDQPPSHASSKAAKDVSHSVRCGRATRDPHLSASSPPTTAPCACGESSSRSRRAQTRPRTAYASQCAADLPPKSTAAPPTVSPSPPRLSKSRLRALQPCSIASHVAIDGLDWSISEYSSRCIALDTTFSGFNRWWQKLRVSTDFRRNLYPQTVVRCAPRRQADQLG